ncbi:MAG: hypothetical protein JW809_17515 [Pirellulales bacterium]|nr:hypothetical protein [Pirellulales bacterium]
MLSCLIVIPLVAVFGTSFPTMVTSLVDRWQGASPAANESFGDAPLFQAGGTSLAGEFDPPRIDMPNPAAAPSGLMPATGGVHPAAVIRDPVVAAGGGMLHPTEAAGALPPGPMTAGYDAPVPSNPPYRNAPVTPPAAAPASSLAEPYRPLASGIGHDSTGNGRDLVPIAPPEQGPAGLGPIGAAADASGNPAQPWGSTQQVDRFTQIHARLRQLGADYHRLESWGTEQALFRFHCRVSLGAGPNLSRQFEATDRDPIGAMTRVLLDVEAWRTGSAPVIRGGG